MRVTAYDSAPRSQSTPHATKTEIPEIKEANFIPNNNNYLSPNMLQSPPQFLLTLTNQAVYTTLPNSTSQPEPAANSTHPHHYSPTSTPSRGSNPHYESAYSALPHVSCTHPISLGPPSSQKEQTYLNSSGTLEIALFINICFKSYITSASSPLKNVIATPLFPALPVRPIRCVYCSILVAILKLITRLTSGTSIPLPARSVATRISA